MVGLGEVLQQIPLAITFDPPSSEMDPTIEAEVVVIVPIEVVEILRLLATKVTSLP